ncbi:uncharacterized protein LOC127442927 [Myxocyprinus asiaticus]|uniref:uncharacterized protein LOC127442927 n=1 Tax=Myxocyprinus asiaticus TaxID=70543 RepID=UPI0022228E96|nr:uncharacterized protein LOC127442927 [Myxocyprinus asiaticus]
MGDPGTREPTHLELVRRPLHPPVEGQVENILLPFCMISPHFQVAVVPNSSAKERLPSSLGHIPGVHGRHHDYRPRVFSCRIGATVVVFPPLSAQLWNTAAPDVAVSTGYEDRPLPPPSQAVPGVVTGSQVSASMSLDSAWPQRGVAPRAPPRREAPPAGMSDDVPLVPLARNLDTWLALSNPSRWLIRTVRHGYVIQFARRPPRFSGIHFTLVKSKNAATLHAEIATLLRKGAIEPVPPAEMKKGIYSPYFIVPKKVLRVLNRALHRLPFKMLTQKRILVSIRHQDWFAAVDLKDAYFHVSILPRHRPFLRFAFEGQAYQYKVLPFGLSLSPRIFTNVAEAALAPLREVGIRILNYLDDWLILAHSRDMLCAHRDLVLSHLS